MSDSSARPPVLIRKLDHAGQETWRYRGERVAHGPHWAQIEAAFNRDDTDAGYVVFRRGDRFVEWFYTDRWYNVFEIHDVTHGHLKGWYCNITRPAHIEADEIAWADLGLDVWVSPAGDVLILDEDEFNALPLDAPTRAMAWQAVETIRTLAAAGDPPFDYRIGA